MSACLKIESCGCGLYLFERKGSKLELTACLSAVMFELLHASDLSDKELYVAMTVAISKHKEEAAPGATNTESGKNNRYI